jgi:hypothetical protein
LRTESAAIKLGQAKKALRDTIRETVSYLLGFRRSFVRPAQPFLIQDNGHAVFRKEMEKCGKKKRWH